MSYSVNITVNLPDDLEYDLGPFELKDLSYLPVLVENLDDRWSSIVMTITNSDPPKVVKTFID